MLGSVSMGSFNNGISEKAVGFEIPRWNLIFHRGISCSPTQLPTSIHKGGGENSVKTLNQLAQQFAAPSIRLRSDAEEFQSLPASLSEAAGMLVTGLRSAGRR